MIRPAQLPLNAIGNMRRHEGRVETPTSCATDSTDNAGSRILALIASFTCSQWTLDSVWAAPSHDDRTHHSAKARNNPLEIFRALVSSVLTDAIRNIEDSRVGTIRE